MVQINNTTVVAELTDLYLKYETALCSNDTDTLTALFWDSSEVVRFGVNENLYGSNDIKAFRESRSPNSVKREIFNLKIVTFDEDIGVVTVEFHRIINRSFCHGRQSQIWYRFSEGWKIVSAHVSYLTKE